MIFDPRVGGEHRKNHDCTKLHRTATSSFRVHILVSTGKDFTLLPGVVPQFPDSEDINEVLVFRGSPSRYVQLYAVEWCSRVWYTEQYQLLTPFTGPQLYGTRLVSCLP